MQISVEDEVLLGSPAGEWGGREVRGGELGEEAGSVRGRSSCSTVSVKASANLIRSAKAELAS